MTHQFLEKMVVCPQISLQNVSVSRSGAYNRSVPSHSTDSAKMP